MALVLKDRIKETSSTTGTGTLTLGGAVDGFRSFADIGDGNTTYYCIADGNNFEVGIGTYTASGTTLARTTVLQTSAGNTNKITCTGNQKVFVTQPASKAAYLDASNELVVASTALSAVQQRWTKTATSNQTVFNGAADNSGPTLAVNSSSHVFLNGIFLKETTDYALSGGTTVTLTAGATVNDIVEVITFTPLSSSITGISDGDIPVFTSGVADNDFLKVAGTSIEGRSASEVLSDIGGQSALTFGISSGNVPTFTSGVVDNDFLKIDGTTVEGRSASEVLSDIGGQASLTFGISNTNAVKIDSSSVADDEYARFTANGLESRSTAEVLSDIGALSTSSASSTYAPLATPTFSSSITTTTSVNVGTNGGFYLIQDSSESNIRSESQPLILQTYASSAWQDRLTVTNVGNVGIGGSPVPSDSQYNTATLHLRQAGTSSSTNKGTQIKFTTGSSGHTASDGGFIAYWHDNNFYLNNQEGGQFRFYSGGTEVINVNSSGHIVLPQTGIVAFNSTSDEYIQGGSGTITMGVNNSAHFKIEDTVSTFGQNDADYTVKIGNSTYAGIYVDGDSDIAMVTPSNDYAIFGANNSRTYLYYNGTNTLYTDANGVYVRTVADATDGNLYLGNQGAARIVGDHYTATYAVTPSSDYFIYGEVNSYTYLYYDGSWKARTVSNGLYVNTELGLPNTGAVRWGGGSLSYIYGHATSDTVIGSYDDLYLNSNWVRYFNASNGNAGTTEYARISTSGNWFSGPIGVNGQATNYGSSGQVLTSQGNASPVWATASAGAWSLVSNNVISSSNHGSSSWLNFSLSAANFYRFTFTSFSFDYYDDYLSLRLSSDGGSSFQTLIGSKRDQSWSQYYSFGGSNQSTSSYFQTTRYTIKASNPACPLTMEILLFACNGRGAVAEGRGFMQDNSNQPTSFHFKCSAYQATTSNYIRFQPHNYGSNSNQAMRGHLKVERWTT